MSGENKSTHGGARPGAGRKKLADARVRKTVFLHQSEWALLESKCQEGETVSQALCRILGQAVTQKQNNANMEAFKRRYRSKHVAKVNSYQGEETGFTERKLDFISEHLSRLYHDIGFVLKKLDPEQDKRALEAYYQQATALEIVLDALDDRVFSNRLERIKTPKGVDAEGVNESLLGD